MNIIDTNGISHIFTDNLTLREDYYLAPDVVEEVEMTQLVHGKRIPNKVLEIAQTEYFDGATYINHYRNILNKYKGRSFYNMTGFGDVSIIATLHTILDVFDRQKLEQLFDTSEQITVYTDDVRLTTNINREFLGKNVAVRPVTDIG